MVGAALRKALGVDSEVELLTQTKDELDLTCQRSVREYFTKNAIDEVYLAAAKVGGINANNSYPADFIYENLMIQCNVIHAAYEAGIQRLLFLGSSCIYPKLSNQPIAEESLLSGWLEQTNEPYAIAKIAGIKLCESYNRQHSVDYRCVMPTNLYGENDNFHPTNSHVIPAMIRRIHEAKQRDDDEVTIWGTGTPMREFLHVSDMAAACIHVMNLSKQDYRLSVDERCSHINVGTGQDCTIRYLAETICRVVGYRGTLSFDTSKPDGAPRKLLNVSRLSALGWSSTVGLEEGLVLTYQWFLENHTSFRGVDQ